MLVFVASDCLTIAAILPRSATYPHQSSVFYKGERQQEMVSPTFFDYSEKTGKQLEYQMRSILRSRINKLDQAVQAEAGTPLRIWVTIYCDMAPEDAVESLTRPLVVKGIDVRRIPPTFNSKTKEWILVYWDQIIPEARELILEKAEEIRSCLGLQGENPRP